MKKKRNPFLVFLTCVLAKMEAGQRYFYSDELYCLKGILQCDFDELFRQEQP